MGTEQRPEANEIKGHESAATPSKECKNEKFSQQTTQTTQQTPQASPSIPVQPSPRVTVSLPDHAASKLRDLVQKRDIALLRLGIISVQFENDQIIPLTLSTSNSKQPKHASTPIKPDDNIQPSGDKQKVECTNGDLPALPITSITSLSSSDVPMIGQDGTLDLDNTTTSKEKTESNTNKLPIVYDEDEEDEKDEDELVSEVENQHSSYNIHQLAQLSEFTDPIELDMYLPF